MIPEAPFLFSIAGLSASLAGLAGLVAALKRAEGSRVADMFRLRQIVEYSFANVLFAISVIPLTALVGDIGKVVAGLGAVVGIYLVAIAVVLARRGRRYGVPFEGATRAIVAVVLLISLLVAGVATATGSMAMFEILLILLIARPMIVFALVLASFETRGGEQRET